VPDLVVMKSGQTISGEIVLEPRGQATGSTPVDRFELFIDGVRIGHTGTGGRLPLDSTTLADGYHELRVVAIDSAPVETQGRVVLPIATANHGRELVLAADPAEVDLRGSVKLSAVGKGVETITVFAGGRVLGRIDGPVGSIDVPASQLGSGPVTINATGRAGSGATEAVNAIPVTVTVGAGR